MTAIGTPNDAVSAAWGEYLQTVMPARATLAAAQLAYEAIMDEALAKRDAALTLALAEKGAGK